VPRLFIGTLADIDEQKRTEQFLSALQSTADAVFADDLKIKFTSVQNLHMTWAFIGDVPQASVEQISQLLNEQMKQIREMKLPPQLHFDCVEFWPDAIQPTLLVLTPAVTPAAVENCARQIMHVARPFKSAPETFPFRAHVTLARLKKGAVSTNVSIAALKSFLPLVLKLTDIGLFESTSVGRQSVYRAVAQFAL
jgi:2'-5' RNA ligase